MSYTRFTLTRSAYFWEAKAYDKRKLVHRRILQDGRDADENLSAALEWVRNNALPAPSEDDTEPDLGGLSR